jgi:hypothetical protein
MPSSPTVGQPSPHPPVGELVELARYAVSDGERVLYGQRIRGVVRVTDRPAAPAGRAFLVERELEQDGAGAHAALQALIADYLDQARVLDAVPMANSLERQYLERLREPS